MGAAIQAQAFVSKMMVVYTYNFFPLPIPFLILVYQALDINPRFVWSLINRVDPLSLRELACLSFQAFFCYLSSLAGSSFIHNCSLYSIFLSRGKEKWQLFILYKTFMKLGARISCSYKSSNFLSLGWKEYPGWEEQEGKRRDEGSFLCSCPTL